MPDLLSILGDLPSGDLGSKLTNHPGVGYRPYAGTVRAAGFFPMSKLPAGASPDQVAKQAESRQQANLLNDWKVRVDAAASLKKVILPVVSVMTLAGCYLGPNRHVYAIDSDGHIGQILSNDKFMVLEGDSLKTEYCTLTLRELSATVCHNSLEAEFADRSAA